MKFKTAKYIILFSLNYLVDCLRNARKENAITSSGRRVIILNRRLRKLMQIILFNFPNAACSSRYGKFVRLKFPACGCTNDFRLFNEPQFIKTSHSIHTIIKITPEKYSGKRMIIMGILFSYAIIVH